MLECDRNVIQYVNEWTKKEIDASYFEANPGSTSGGDPNPITRLLPKEQNPLSYVMAFDSLDNIVDKHFSTPNDRVEDGYDTYPIGVKHLKILLRIIRGRNDGKAAVFNHISICTISQFPIIIQELFYLLDQDSNTPPLLEKYVLCNVSHTGLQQWNHEEESWTTTNVTGSDKDDLLYLILTETNNNLQKDSTKHKFFNSAVGPIVIMWHALNHFYEYRKQTGMHDVDDISRYLLNQFSDFLGVVMSAIFMHEEFNGLSCAKPGGVLHLRY
ncbi:hypothetical protein Leryth_025454 [Lithospermum erythrorhizon]|nr:hypothetical protein Leryth_025454 [Lithospermum erythrorhizon]